jgi:aryl-alcohol dehydrogenase-like predicted oxidoreductase
LGATQSQLALAWCLKNENVSSVITGASRPDQIVENVKCLAVLEKLTAEIMDEIDRVIENKPNPDPARQD